MSPYDQAYILTITDPPVMSSVTKNSHPPAPLQVYSCRHTSHRPSDDSLRVSTPLPPPALIVELDLPIAIRKGIHFTRNSSPHYTALSYHILYQPFYTFLFFISSISIPKIVGDALAHLGWRKTMLDEISAL